MRLVARQAARPDELVAAEIAASGAAGVALPRLAQLAGLASARVAALLPAVPALVADGRAAVAQASYDTIVADTAAVLAGQTGR